MKFRFAMVMALTCALSMPLRADLTSYTISPKSAAAPSIMIAPQTMPQTLTSVVSQDVYLVGLTVAAPAGVTVLVQDKNGTPIPLVPTVTGATNVLWVLNLPFLYWCPGGFSVQAGGASVYFYAVWKVK